MLDPGQLDVLRRLAADLDERQRIWASGYLAALGGADPSPGLAAAGTGADATPAPAARPTTVLHGSQTGNSRAIAERLAREAKGQGMDVRVQSMGEYKRAQLKAESRLLVVVSTHGEGDPPDDAREFYEYLGGERAPRLDGLEFAVLALGDSTYERYCEAGRALDTRLGDLGASRLRPLAECDIDFDADARRWTDAVLALAQSGGGEESPGAAAVRVGTPDGGDDGEPAWSRSRPFEATVLENVRLTAPGSDKRTHHIELSLEGSGIGFEPGDSLGVWPRNGADRVAKVAGALGVPPGEPVEIDGRVAPVGEWLSRGLEIARITPRVLRRYADIAGDGALSRIAADVNRADRFAHGRDLGDLLGKFPPPPGRVADILSALRRLAPRFYSLASSHAAREGEAHLLVGCDRFATRHGSVSEGLCSSWLAGLRPGDAAEVYVQPNPAFRLSGDDIPVIMVGPGTGVAPFRAFLEERELRGATGDNWLFYGGRRFDDDYYYQREWLAHTARGLLTRLDVAFSRDPAHPRRHVQHRMLAESARLWEWIGRGAHVYVCGDEARMAKDVETALGEIAAREGGENPERFLARLVDEGRYQRDVY